MDPSDTAQACHSRHATVDDSRARRAHGCLHGHRPRPDGRAGGRSAGTGRGELLHTSAPDTVGPAFYGLIRLDEFLATRVAEAVIHGLDLTDALGRGPLPMPKAVPIAAAVLDEVVARTRVPGRPADLAGDDLAFVRAASGRGEHPDPRLPVVR